MNRRRKIAYDLWSENKFFQFVAQQMAMKCGQKINDTSCVARQMTVILLTENELFQLFSSPKRRDLFKFNHKVTLS